MQGEKELRVKMSRNRKKGIKDKGAKGIRGKVFKNRPSKICGRQPLKF